MQSSTVSSCVYNITYFAGVESYQGNRNTKGALDYFQNIF